MFTNNTVILAADGLSLEKTVEKVQRIGKNVHVVKAHDLYDRHGPMALKALREAGAERVWVDFKIHDIAKKTAELRARALVEAGANILSVHASSGIESMQAVMRSGASEVYGITVLTSLSPEEVARIYGKERTLQEIVREFALMAKEAGLTGVVCSPKEVGLLSKDPALAGLKFVTPGVRSAGTDPGGQKRFDTPRAALEAGATHLVVGSQIVDAPDPMKALRQINNEIAPFVIRQMFEARDAMWFHNGDPKMPHGELTSGQCSDGFINTLGALCDTQLCEMMADYMVEKVREVYQGPVDWVVGSDHAGATLSYAVAVRLKAKHDFTEKGDDKTQLWKRHTIKKGEVVLQVEELVTTLGTLKAVREGIQRDNPQPVTFAPLVATLIHRSPSYEFENAPIVQGAHFDIRTWDEKDCPLCKAGSKRLKPKKNWEELTRSYS